MVSTCSDWQPIIACNSIKLLHDEWQEGIHKQHNAHYNPCSPVWDAFPDHRLSGATQHQPPQKQEQLPVVVCLGVSTPPSINRIACGTSTINQPDTIMPGIEGTPGKDRDGMPPLRQCNHSLNPPFGIVCDYPLSDSGVDEGANGQWGDEIVEQDPLVIVPAEQVIIIPVSDGQEVIVVPTAPQEIVVDGNSTIDDSRTAQEEEIAQLFAHLCTLLEGMCNWYVQYHHCIPH